MTRPHRVTLTDAEGRVLTEYWVPDTGQRPYYRTWLPVAWPDATTATITDADGREVERIDLR